MSEKIVDVEAKEVNKTEETKEVKRGFIDGLRDKARMVDWKKVGKTAGLIVGGAVIAGISYSLGAKSSRHDDEITYGIPDYIDEEEETEEETTDENSEEEETEEE